MPQGATRLLWPEAKRLLERLDGSSSDGRERNDKRSRHAAATGRTALPAASQQEAATSGPSTRYLTLGTALVSWCAFGTHGFAVL